VFDADLYRGTAEDYDRYRLRYPPELLSSLLSRVTGRGRMMDLACGTGQLAFALCPAFESTWAVDQEPSMVAVVASRAVPSVRAVVASASLLRAPAAAFDLIAVGNAFHRLDRDRVASLAYSWLKPGGSLALCWSDSPWTGPAPWQATLRDIMASWRSRLGDRLPADWSAGRTARPDAAVLAAAGFTVGDRFTCTLRHGWTAASLAGFVYSTSVLPRSFFGALTPEFESELARRLPGDLTSETSYAYDLATKPLAQDPRTL
jgi:SAM-dependent methyltransferase